MGGDSRRARTERVIPVSFSIGQRGELMEIVACEQPAELDLAELLRCIFCGVEGGGLSWVERSDF